MEYEHDIKVRIIDFNQKPVSTVICMTEEEFNDEICSAKLKLQRTFPWGCYNLKDKSVCVAILNKKEERTDEATIYRQGYIVDNKEVREETHICIFED